MNTTEAEYAARLRQALVALKKMQAELDAERHAKSEPIAIIGMGCRFPGGADTPEGFWQLLANRVDAIVEVPANRWDDDPFVHRDEPMPEERSTRWAGFLQEPLDVFDAQHFGISPREANCIDPQQRLLLEVTWEALERAGQIPQQLMGTQTGVFLGINTNDYEHFGLATDPKDLDIYTATGNGHCFPPGRISYALGLQGPSMCVDTACSSSLVAIHLACQSLRNRECNLAVSGGVNVMLLPWLTYLFASSQALSPDGRCKTFDSRANGYVRGEGCGIIVLKRLSDAVAAGDTILAQIRGSVVNQDGRSTGLTAPNALAQQAMLRQALYNAQVTAADISYVETHGTGTALGDPIEFEALSAVVGQPRADGSKCVLGAVKSNVGHLEAAAGVAGLIKLVLSLENEAIPPNLHFKRLNPRLSLDGTALQLPTDMVPWQPGEKPRMAGVSSFGISGTNCHAVVAEAPPAPALPQRDDNATYVLPLSARTPAGLIELARSYRRHFADIADSSTSALVHNQHLADITYTASTRRYHYKHRLAAVGNSRRELDAALAGFINSAAPVGLVQGEAAGTPRKVVFVFPGQGSQWLGMGRQLLATEAGFRTALEACDQAIRAETGWSVLEELEATPEASHLDHIDVIQPTLFAIAVGLAALWRSLGVEPDAVVGHSMGEVAAAHVAGALSLADAASIICRRSRLLRQVSGQGEMAVVELSLDEARAALAGYEDQLSVAVSNSARSTVISGAPEALAAVLERLAAEQVFCRRVKVDVASHSPQMDPLRPALLDALAALAPQTAEISMYSTVTGAVLAGTELDADYWTRNLREPVLFHQVITQLIGSDHTLFVEMSPHPLLVPAVEEALRQHAPKTTDDAQTAGCALPSMRRDHEDRRIFMESLAAIYAHGGPLDWAGLYPEGGRIVPLPTNPWQREHYWFESTQGAKPKTVTPTVASAQTGPVHRNQASQPLLGAPVSFAMMPDARCWEQGLSIEAQPYLAAHQVRGVTVVPGTAYIEMGLRAGGAIYGNAPFVVENIGYEQFLVLADDVRTVQTTVTERDAGRATFLVSSRDDDASRWQRHVTGSMRPDTDRAEQPVAGETPAQIQERCTTAMPGAEYYAITSTQGLDYGDQFRGIHQLWIGDGEVLGQIHLPDSVAVPASAYTLHPALLDACFQVPGALIFAGDQAASNARGVYVAAGVDRLRILHQPERDLWVHARWAPGARGDDNGDGTDNSNGAGSSTAGDRAWDILLLDDDGRVLVEVHGVRARRADHIPGARPLGESWLYTRAWQRQDPVSATEVPAAASGSRPSAWLLCVDEHKTGTGLAGRLQAQGASCVRLVRGDGYRCIEPGLYQIDAENPDSWRQALADAFGDHTDCRGVMHCWSLDAALATANTAETLMTDQQLSVISALHLAQALLRHSWRETPPLLLVTRGVHTAANEPGASLSQAPLWGLGLVLAIEHPELRCKCIDLSANAAAPAASGEEIAQLFGELMVADGEDQVALRADGRYVARLVRGRFDDAIGQDRGADNTAPVHDDATYLITGGLGGLGLSVAQWMVDRGARHLVLMGRRGPSDAARTAIAAMQAAGAEVVVASADVAEHSDIKRVIDDIAARDMPRLRGVVHAAGILDDATVLQIEAAQFTKVMAPKVLGAWHLHQLTADTELDFFVLYSSAASLMGSPGQSNYVAANGFLDALAHHRRQRGLPGLSINWGPFADVGLAAAETNRGQRLVDRGAASIAPEQGVRILETLLAGSSAQMGVVPLDIKRWLGFLPPSVGRSPFWSELVTGDDVAATAIDSAPDSGFWDRFRAAESGERRELLVQHVTAHVAAVIRQDAAKIAPTATFFNLGMDSLMNIELRNRLEASLRIELSVATLLNHPEPATLANYLLGQLDNSDQPAGAIAASAAPAHTAVTATGAEAGTPWLAYSKRAQRPRMRLVCIPGAGASAVFFRGWQDSVPSDWDFDAIEFPAHGSRLAEPHLQQFDAVVPALAQALRPHLEAPFVLFGHSFGSLFAFELTRYLGKQGLAPAHLFVSAFAAPQVSAGISFAYAEDDASFLAWARARGFISDDIPRAYDDALIRSYVPSLRQDLNMINTYQYVAGEPLDIPISLFGATDDSLIAPAQLEPWREVTRAEFSLQMCDGDHFFARDAGATLMAEITAKVGKND